VSDYELLVKRIGLTGIASFVVALSPVLLLPILTKILTIQEYGLWSLILVTASFVPMVVLLGLPNSMVRFLAPVKNKDEIREGYYSIALVVLGVGFVSSLFLLVFEHWIAADLLSNNRTVALLLPLITFVAAYNYVPQTYFRTFQQAKRYSLVAFLQAASYVILVGALVVVGLGLAGAVFAYLINLLLIAVISTYYVMRDIGVIVPRFTGLKAYLKYGLPLVPSSVSSWALSVSDRYIITFFLSVAWVGYYSPGYQLGWIISLLAAPLTILVPTALYEYYDANRIAEVKTIIRYSVKYFLAVAVPAAFVLSLLSKPILLVLTTPAIATNGYLITPFTAVSAVLFGVWSIIAIVLTFEKRTAIIGTIWVLGAALNIGLNLVLVPYFGIIAAALTTLLGYGFIFGLTAMYSIRRMTLDVDFGFILKSIFASIVISSFVLVWHASGLLSISALIVICAVVYTAILFVLKGFTASEIRFFGGFLAGQR
jgi:O-antigen/teichoic acid export membrane protein